VPGINVQVGDQVVRSDANGNYDRNGLPPGVYLVQLQLSAGQGEPVQGPLDITLPAGATVVQHLALRTPPEPTPSEPTAIPEATAPQAPTEAPLPSVIVPVETPPATLPRTASATGTPTALLMLLGMALIGVGLFSRSRHSVK
jgi:hypothetical protein